MPCLYISTNVCLDGVDTDPLVVEATKACASIIGKPENVCSLYYIADIISVRKMFHKRLIHYLKWLYLLALS